MMDSPPGRPLFVLNPDLVPDPGALGRMLDALDDPEVGVVVPRVDDVDGVPVGAVVVPVGAVVVAVAVGHGAPWLSRGGVVTTVGKPVTGPGGGRER